MAWLSMYLFYHKTGEKSINLTPEMDRNWCQYWCQIGVKVDVRLVSILVSMQGIRQTVSEAYLPEIP